MSTSPLNLPGPPPTTAALNVARSAREAIAILNAMESRARREAYDSMAFHGPWFVRDPNNPNRTGNCKNCGGIGVVMDKKGRVGTCGFNHAELFAEPDPEPEPETSHRGHVVSRCGVRQPGDSEACDGVHWSNGETTGGCCDPCSFAMRKAGSGNPPFLHDQDLADEIERLMLRRSRGDLRKG